MAAAWPVLGPFGLAAILAAGVPLERERLIVDKERRLGHAARDMLTGLLNRRGSGTEVARLMREMRGGALLLLDHVKRVNDTVGHATGDAALRSFAARLCEASRPKDVVARVGGEEVVVFLPHRSLQGAQDAAAAALRGGARPAHCPALRSTSRRHRERGWRLDRRPGQLRRAHGGGGRRASRRLRAPGATAGALT